MRLQFPRFGLHSPLHARPGRAGFTLTELLVVIGLVVLLLTMAVAAFNFITGSKSIDAAQNLVSAVLVRARSEAIAGQRQMGVLFYRDTANDRTAMMLVQGEEGDTGANDYNIWRTGVDYKIGDVVYYIDYQTPAGANEATKGNALLWKDAGTDSVDPSDDNYDSQPVEMKAVVVKYRAIADSNSNAPPASTGTPPRSNAYWSEESIASFQPFAADIEYLQPGVGLQLINDPQGQLTNNDQFLRTGVIMFDGTGQLVSVPYSIDETQVMGKVIGLDPGQFIPRASAALPPLFTHIGIMLYEREAFSNVQNSSEADIRFDIGTAASPVAADETNEEQWLADNGLLLMINRYNGTLIRGE
jgi:prepilin-type N-terminal cleavage/methylation domain-containing protein